MAQYTIKLTVEAGRIDALRKKLASTFPDEAASVEKINRNPSRADRLSEAESSIEDAKSIIEELKDEMQNWYDSLPENLQQGDKASQIEECVNNLESLYDSIDSATGEFGSIEFPGMY